MFDIIKSYLFDSDEEKRIKTQLESIRNIRAGLERDVGPNDKFIHGFLEGLRRDEEALEAQLLACKKKMWGGAPPSFIFYFIS
jgi:hypothetical protein